MSAPVNPVDSTDYVNSSDYDKLSFKLKSLVSVMETSMQRNVQSRRLRYTEIDIEAKRASGEIGPDEIYVPQHIIDTNIRREQASYIQYLTQSQRACIFQNVNDTTQDTTILEKDFTNRVRYNDWQIPMFANIDSFQQNGYSVLEMIFDESKPGSVAYEEIQLGDFGIAVDTKDIQQQEMVARNFYFTKTELMEMSEPGSNWKFERSQVEKILAGQPQATDDTTNSSSERSLYRVQKVMFRVKGIVQVAWACYGRCDGWVRQPRPLFLGRKKAVITQTLTSTIIPLSAQQIMPTQTVTYQDDFETQYPYYVFPYLISENNTIEKLKGRVYLDQDTQTAVSSLFSSICTGYRRASMLLFSRDTDDPNGDVGMKKNVQFKNGAILDNKLKSFNLPYPDPSSLSAVMALMTTNQAETSKVNFAANNRKDSRKTATEVQASTQEAASLSTVQVVLFSTALKKLYTVSFEIISSRVNAGLIEVAPDVKPYYDAKLKYSIRPAGDVDVIERQNMISSMMSAWPVMQGTPAATAFLSDILSKMFPEHASKYIKIFSEADAAAKSQQVIQQQAMMGRAMEIGKQLITLSGRPEMFSETGKIHVLPIIQNVAQELASFIKPNQV